MSGRRARVAAGLAFAVMAVVATISEWQSPSHRDHVLYLVFGLPVGISFMVAGLIAWTRRPSNPTGRLMVAVALAFMIGGFTASTNDLVFTLGVAVNLWPTLLALLLLSYPGGELDRTSRWLVAVTFVATQGLTLLELPISQPRLDESGFDRQSSSNLCLISHHPDAVSVIDATSTAMGVAVIVAILVVLTRRWRSATPAARRVLTPVYATGGAAIALLLVAVVAAQVSGDGSLVPYLGFTVAMTAIPVAFLLGILRTRLDRSSAVERVVEAMRGGYSPGRLEVALRHALNDPALELAYRRTDTGDLVTAGGVPYLLPPSDSGRAVTPIERRGEEVALIVHDATLLDEPDVIAAVGGPAGLAIENERLQAELRARIHEVSASEQRLRDILEGVALLAVSTDMAGRITFCNRYLCELTGWRREELLGRSWAETFDPGSRLADDLAAGRIEPYVETQIQTRDGAVRDVAWSTTMMRDAEGRVVGATGIGQDTTERNRAVAELAASRARIVAAGDAERRRLERNLHDGAQQRLVALSLALRMAESAVEPGTEARAILADAAGQLAAALEELRELARGIHPAILTDQGLETAVTVLAGRSTVPVDLSIELPQRLSAAVEAAAYYTVAEALTNVAKYAGATRVAVRLSTPGERLLVEVVDDGVGGARTDGGTGLRGLADRVAALGGTLSVESARGSGTSVSADLPAATAAAGAPRAAAHAT